MAIKEIIDKSKAIIFDFDGTLVDSMWVWKSIDIEYLSSVGHELPDDLQKCIEGMSFFETAQYFKNRFNISSTTEEIIDTWNSMAFDKYCNDVILKNGVKDFLIYLKQNNKLVGIATSNSRILTCEALKRKGIIQYFDLILTGDECKKGKPEPDVYIKTADELNVNYNECIVFEDIPAGIIAGKRAGMTTVAVADEYSEYQWQTKIDLADYYITDYMEILNEVFNS